MTGVDLPLAVLAVFWLLLCPVAWATHRFARPWLSTLPPRERSALLLALALLPPAVAGLVAVLGFAPAIGGLIVDDHCHPGTGCVPHVPTLHADAAYAVLLATVLVGAAASLLWSIVGRLRRSLRLASSLRHLAEGAQRQDFEIIQSREQFAYCLGLLRPRIVVSQGLIDRLTPTQLQVVLRHEEAHATRRDNLRHWLAALALLPLPRALRQPLLNDLTLASEHASDHAAARHAGGAALVIETLAALTPSSGTNARRTGATFDRASTIKSRITALQTESSRAPTAAAIPALIVSVYAACAVSATYAAHHGTELVLGWLA